MRFSVQRFPDCVYDNVFMFNQFSRLSLSCPTAPAAVHVTAPPSHKVECDMNTEYPTWDQFFDFVDETAPCESMVSGGV